MSYFVREDSIVRQIWGNGDTILFIFAGSAAEFALNKAVDWLYFTGRLPADPLGRLFSTVTYARQIVFSEEAAALATIDQMAKIHASVEAKRGQHIPDWAYRDVLFMLIDYSIRAYEVLQRKLSLEEKTEVFEVFNRVGHRMGLKELPVTFAHWQVMRKEHLQQDLQKSHYTTDLYRQYRKHLGFVRYRLLLEGQKLVVPRQVKQLLGFGSLPVLAPVLAAYKLIRKFQLDWLLKSVLLPGAYKNQIRNLDRQPVQS
ncbi:oxygenase MpaB family protein [Pontibacter sp. 13R65]|uniref:oxygenase MpaB family protein n=1 Tax=Pontibacter sp. 13R65 TaxID=3127458 RepID=UPI00301DD812